MSLAGIFQNFISNLQVKTTAAKAMADAEAGNHEAAWAGVEALLAFQRQHRYAARWLVQVVGHGSLPREKALEVLTQVYEAHSRNQLLVGLLGDTLEAVSDIDMLNRPPPEHSLFSRVVDTLSEFLKEAKGRRNQVRLLSALATSARMMARQRDEIAERSHRRLVEMAPSASNHYNLGLYLKTRGRFREGMLANQAAVARRIGSDEATDWNLGICATGAGEAAVALEVWKRMGNKIEMGRFGLPDGNYRNTKVRLSQRPLAEREVGSDDPGLEESIWVERLSPCHGIIRSVLYQDLGVNYGDVILFDGAPITHHKYGDTQVPVFPHLATLVRSHYRIFDFAGTQEEKGQLADASEDLAADAVVYPHSESFFTLCAACWRNPDTEHRHDRGGEKKTVITGKVAAPPGMAPRELLDQLDAAMAKREPCRLYVPDLCEAAGLVERAAVDRRRFNMIGSGSSDDLRLK